MTSLAINQDPPRENGTGWRTTLIGGLFAVVMAIAGWVATTAQTERVETQRDLNAQAQRIAVLEESQRNQRETLSEIKGLLEDIRRQMQERRR